MSIASESSKVMYQGNGSTVSFNIPFYFLKDEDIKVLLQKQNAEEQLLQSESEYMLTLGELGGTCNLHTAPAEGETLIIYRDPAILQETAYVDGVPLSAKAREDSLDLLTMICQANRERTDRAVKFNIATSAENIVMPEPEAGRAIIWNADGSNLKNGPTISDIDAVQDNAALATKAAQEATVANNEVQEALSGGVASGIRFEPSGSGLEATNVADALQELKAQFPSKAEAQHLHSLAEITDKGTAAGLNAGTGASNLVQLDAGAKLPAINASQLTHIQPETYISCAGFNGTQQGVQFVLPEGTEHIQIYMFNVIVTGKTHHVLRVGTAQDGFLSKGYQSCSAGANQFRTPYSDKNQASGFYFYSNTNSTYSGNTFKVELKRLHNYIFCSHYGTYYNNGVCGAGWVHCPNPLNKLFFTVYNTRYFFRGGAIYIYAGGQKQW